MEKITLKNASKSNDIEDFNYKKIYDNCHIDLSEVMMLPPTALGIGHHEYKGNTYLNNTFSYGEFSTIKAKSKTKKTFFKSALIAGYIGGNITNYFCEFKTQRDQEWHVIDIDTEQGDYYAQRAFRRVAELVGDAYVHYYPFGLEALNPAQIIQFIDELFKDPKHKGKIKWLSIDGIADLVENINDIKESVAVASKLKMWRKDNNCHINCVIHKIRDGKSIGHLGSYIEKKSETVIDLEDTDPDPKNMNSPIEVVHSFSRGAPFTPFHFKLDNDTLPKECNVNTDEWT
jgi:hypothetical protein